VEVLGDPADQVSVSVFVIEYFRAIAFDPRLELGEIDGGVEDADIDGSNNSLIIIEKHGAHDESRHVKRKRRFFFGSPLTFKESRRIAISWSPITT